LPVNGALMRAKVTTHVSILVRHAEAPFDATERANLTDRGRAHALAISKLLEDLSIDAIYSSPYPRARQTVEPLAHARDLEIREIHDLRERRLSAEPIADWERALRECWDDFSRAHPGGESSAEAQRRVVAVHRELIRRHPEDTVVIGSHGNLVALLVNHYLPHHGHGFWKALTNPDVYRLAVSPNGSIELSRIWK
jgi:2,3-bisphosphoglycerate-dependent phosphoglycerate mutase